MNFNKNLFVFILLVSTLAALSWLIQRYPPLVNNSFESQQYGKLISSKPLWGSKALVVVFADSHNYNLTDLAQNLAKQQTTAVMIDSQSFWRNFSTTSAECLDYQNLATSLIEIQKHSLTSTAKRVIVTGIAEAALLPFINALNSDNGNISNISIDFKSQIPADIKLCPSLIEENQLTSKKLPIENLANHWQVVWPDQPEDKTAIFIRSLGQINTKIAEYDTPLAQLLINSVQQVLANASSPSLSMPVVEVPAKTNNNNLTIFYSGDGGWRDLDRTVAGLMAEKQQSVLGVDVLRYFWAHKSVEQVAKDLSQTMAYYRQHWGSTEFVLAGYSFGADILPAVYNHLNANDQASVKLLALLALAQHADFEIHVSGWLGKESEEQHPIIPELVAIPKEKLLCIYGLEEQSESACPSLANTEAKIIALPGGHHFDEDYEKLTRLILEVYDQHNLSEK